jgi:ketosteroid isomerase-like protein
METLENRVLELESRVRELEDLREIETLRFDYHIAVNERRVAEIASLFSEDGEAHFGEIGSAKGRPAIAEFYREVVGGSPFIKQFIHNHRVEVAGNSATGLSYLEARTVRDGESIMVAARFDDTYVREGVRWRFREVRLTPFFVAPLSEGWVDAALADPGKE